MKKSALYIPLYLGTFIVAFTGFFYARLNSQNHSSDELSQHTSDQVAIASAEQNPSAWRNAHAIKAASLSPEQPDSDEHMIDSKKVRKSIDVKQTDKISHERNTVYHPQPASAPGMSHTAEYNEAETAATGRNTGTTAMNIVGYSDYSSNSTFGYNTSSTETTGEYDKPSVSADNLSDTGTDSVAEIVSDGSEFLPDGSSQEDLANSLSKNPLVYTIKDYQQASISCDNSYGAPSAHAELLFKLKGC